MKRKINFRMWDDITKRFYYLYLLEIIGVGDRTINIPKNAIIQQYTGLKDKNNKEIYEGDILKYDIEDGLYRQGVVEFSNYFNGWVINSGHEVESLELPFLSFHTVEVVGNIFENKELLK